MNHYFSILAIMKLYRLITTIALIYCFCATTHAQDTFSIVAVDSATGEVGSAGASCVDLVVFFPNFATDFLGDLIPGLGAINTQASYLAANQNNARTRMLAGDTPAQIINWLAANDVQGSSVSRQYGVAALVNGAAEAAGFTGVNCLNYKNHITGPNYSIQGNILLNQAILDSMEARFLNESGDLACKLMAAMQGANVVGADTRCAGNGTSSLFAFLKVAQPTDTIGNPSFLVSVKTTSNSGIEPIDSLQNLFNAAKNCSITGMPIPPLSDVTIYPNPVNNVLHIQVGSNSKIDRYKMYDLKGRILLDEKVSDSHVQLDLHLLLEGVYLLDLYGSAGITHHKIIRK